MVSDKIAVLIPTHRPTTFPYPSGHHFQAAFRFSCQSGWLGAQVGRVWGKTLKGLTPNPKGFAPRVGRGWGKP